MKEFLESAGRYWIALPGPLRALLTILAGSLAAWLLRILTIAFLKVLRFEEFSTRSGLAEFLRKGRVTYSAGKLAGMAAWWLAMGTTLILAAMALDNRIVASLAERFISAFPRILAALIITGLGMALVTFLANFAETLARNAAFMRASLLGRVLRAVGDLVVLMVAVDQIGVATAVLNAMLLVLWAGIVLALALAFGLGCKDLAKEGAQRLMRALERRDREDGGADLEG